MPTPSCLFYIVVALVALAPWLFIWSIWHEAHVHDWIWLNKESRSMYVDAVKTLIAASGIAVALLASSARPAANPSEIVVSSARIAAVCLVLCVGLSLVVIFALARGFERAQSRYGDEQRRAGQSADGSQGKLTRAELLFILLFAAPSLSLFLVGFAFLARIAYHF